MPSLWFLTKHHLLYYHDTGDTVFLKKLPHDGQTDFIPSTRNDTDAFLVLPKLSFEDDDSTNMKAFSIWTESNTNSYNDHRTDSWQQESPTRGAEAQEMTPVLGRHWS